MAPIPTTFVDRRRSGSMIKLEELQRGAAVRGIIPDAMVVVVSVQWFGSEALEFTYKVPTGKVANELLYRHDEPRLELVEQGRPWGFDGDGALFRLVSEAQRIRLAHLFDPVLAVHTSVVDPLPHQITAVYESMLPRQAIALPARRRPGLGQDHHGWPVHQGADRPWRPAAVPDRVPGQSGRAVAGRALPSLPPAARLSEDEGEIGGPAYADAVTMYLGVYCLKDHFLSLHTRHMEGS